MAQEFLTTFENELKGVTLQPSETSGDFHISIDGKKVFDRKEFGGFPEIKELKQMVRDVVSPGKVWGILTLKHIIQTKNNAGYYFMRRAKQQNGQRQRLTKA